MVGPIIIAPSQLTFRVSASFQETSDEVTGGNPAQMEDYLTNDSAQADSSVSQESLQCLAEFSADDNHRGSERFLYSGNYQMRHDQYLIVISAKVLSLFKTRLCNVHDISA